jgi:two-component system KDP operon response regulator KdpE
MRAAGRVLVVDDDAMFLAAIRDLLRDEGYAVDVATTAGAALDQLWQDWDRQPDAILLDLHLPLLDGQTFAELYTLLPVRRAPIILMTGDSQAATHALVADAAGTLRKPFDAAELLALLHRVTRGEPTGQPDNRAGELGSPAGGRVA